MWELRGVLQLACEDWPREHGRGWKLVHRRH